MITKTRLAIKSYDVTFSPTDKQVAEIEKWLIAEKQKSRDGFYCNWNIIKSSFDHNQLATISHNNRTIGFATWWLTSDKTARIGIMEVKPTQRKKGIGKKLTNELLVFLKERGVCVVDLQCSSETSESIWKRLGFVDFPDPTEKYKANSDVNKKLYTILTKHLETSLLQDSQEVIELWDNEPYMTDKDSSSTYLWNLKFVEGSRKLSQPIIYPAHYKWRLRWRMNDKTIKDDEVKRFPTVIDFGTFIIIDQLPL